MRLAGWWIALAALYLVLAWSLAPAELVVAVLAATVGTVGAALAGARVTLPPLAAWRPLLGLFTDLPRLAAALSRRRGGHFETVPDDGASPALGSLAPACIVVRNEDGEVLRHRL